MLRSYVFIFATIPLIAVSDPFQLELKCAYDWQCPYDSFCASDLHLCRCKPSRPVRIISNSFCVPALKLGERCDYSDSCRYYDVNSVCHVRKGCICRDGYRAMKLNLYDPLKCVPKDSHYYGFWPYEEDSDEDSDEDDDDNQDRIVKSDVATPIIVGIVLGSAILCGWSCAICRVYLKKMEKQKKREQHRRLRRFKSNTRRMDSSIDFPRQTEYSLLPTQAVQLDVVNENHPVIVNDAIPATNTSNESVPLDLNSSQISAQFCPDEEPLPGYEGERKDSPDVDCPPSYEEVMKESSEI